MNQKSLKVLPSQRKLGSPPQQQKDSPPQSSHPFQRQKLSDNQLRLLFVRLYLKPEHEEDWRKLLQQFDPLDQNLSEPEQLRKLEQMFQELKKQNLLDFPLSKLPDLARLG